MPERRAVALDYEAGTGAAPKVVASGGGYVADRITAAAQAAGVPVRRDAALTEALAKLELDAEIPEPLYLAVAEALAWAYGLERGSAA